MGDGRNRAWRRVLCLLLILGLLGGALPRARAADGATRHVKICVKDVSHCNVYYSEGGRLVPIGAGTTIEKDTRGPYGILFFAAPHEGYALSAMGATSSAGQYFTISDGQPDGTGCEFCVANNGKNVSKLRSDAGFTQEQIQSILTEAIALGCDGVLMFTRDANNSGGVTSNLMFGAEQLPTLGKSIVSVTPAGGGTGVPYYSGISVGEGDVINYELSVTFYPLENPTYAVEYWDVYVLDEMTGHGADDPIVISPPGQSGTGLQVVTEQVPYTITRQDVERGEVINQAQLHYQYKSLHSAGQLSTVSSAQAEISVHASVNYQYVSGTAGMTLPVELAALTPADYDYHNEGTAVTVKGHTASQPFWDAENNGYWTLLNDGEWTGFDGLLAPGDGFTMPDTPVVLTAAWIFTGAPAIAVEKSGSITEVPDGASAQEGQTVEYSASYTLTIRNTGGETLKTFSVCDGTLENETGVSAETGATVVSLQETSFDPQSHTLSFALETGLPAGETLTLVWTGQRTGTLGYKLLLTDESAAGVTAAGARTGVEVRDDTALSIQAALETDIILSPADIVIYAGGDARGSNVVQNTNLPEPGFFVILPLEAERALREKLGTQEQVDLSPYLTFTDRMGSLWGLELFCETYSQAKGNYIYRLIPKNDVGQTSFQMRFYDEKSNQYILQSEFHIQDALQQEYEMSIDPGEVPAMDVQAVLTVRGTEVGRYGLGMSPGKLVIRGTTGARTTTAIETAAPEQVTQITALASDPSVQYYINESELTVDPKNVALLVDHIVDDGYDQTLRDLAAPAMSRIEAQGPLRCQFRYLDLVDTSMGNTWVTAGGPLEVVWPYPDGTGREDDFTIIHYKGLDRDYNLSDMAGLQLGRNYTLEVYTTGVLPQDPPDHVTYYPLTRGIWGLSFTVEQFSPYVLVWEGEVQSNGGTSSAGKPAGLNTRDHIAYLMGRGDGGIQPLEPITRGQLASVLFRLLTDEARQTYWDTGLYYTDVDQDTWCRNAVATLTSMGILQGYGDGTFRPGAPITRAEFTVIAVRFFQPPESEGEIPFSDVDPEDWFAGAVCSAASLGLVKGRKDGTFDPYATITRAEAAVILNRVLGRKTDGTRPEELAERWYDNPPQAWYYADLLEASVSHSYVEADGGERWTALLEDRDWTALERTAPEGE